VAESVARLLRLQRAVARCDPRRAVVFIHAAAWAAVVSRVVACEKTTAEARQRDCFYYTIVQTYDEGLHSSVLRDHTVGPKNVENGDNHSTAPKRNMERSGRGKLVQGVNL